MDEFIYVPQGCFAQITGETPDNVVGLVTSSMKNCGHVIVTNTANKYTALCHTDSSTDLGDERTELPSWLKSACPDNNYKNLRIYVGEEKDTISSRNESNKS